MDFIKKYLRFHQAVLLAVYSLTLISAFLYYTIGNPPKSYFSYKHNIFNQYFVKIGWFWVTLVYFGYLYFVRTKRLQKTSSFVGSLARYILVTCYWYFLTQWLFGPSFIDRIYVLSGGRCVSLLQDTDMNAQLATVLEQKVCRNLGGQWTGGHDVSGHCVLLLHASLFLWEELSWLFYDVKPLNNMKVRDRFQYWSVMSVLGLLGLWWFMLFMTGVYFHGHFEVLSGSIFGFMGWAILVSLSIYSMIVN